jgi:hypothetical protein
MNKDVIKYLVIAVGGYLVYQYVIAPMLAAPSVPAAGTGTPVGSGSGSGATVVPINGTNGGSAITDAATQQAALLKAQQDAAAVLAAQQAQRQAIADAAAAAKLAALPSQVPDSTFTSSDYGTNAWVARVGAAMAQAAGASTQRIGNWSWYYQNSAGGSEISPQLYGAIVDGSGGTDDTVVQATDFLTLLTAARAKGVSGLGDIISVPLGLGTFWGRVN